MCAMSNSKIDVDLYNVAKDGENESGDCFFYKQVDDMFVCTLADGLGSGPLAQESSEIIIHLLQENPNMDNDTLVRLANERLLKKRGVVLGILRIYLTEKRYSYSSIGNIGLITIKKDDKRVRNIPQHGYLSNRYCKLKEISGDLESGMNFILYSDGIGEAEIARVDFSRGSPSCLIKHFEQHVDEERKDDTTLIAIQYDNETEI